MEFKSCSFACKTRIKERVMFYDFLDLKTKVGLVLTILLSIASVVSFIFAYTSPEATDAFSALEVGIGYRYFAFCITSMVSVGFVTIKRYYKLNN